MGYTKNTKIKLLSNMYQDKVEIEPEALINIIDSIIDDLNKKDIHPSIINNLENYKELIHTESQY